MSFFMLVLSLRFIGFGGDTPPITGDDLPREQGAKMYVVHKMRGNSWQWECIGREEVRQSPHAGPLTAMVATFS
jgi:hypothetical protein